MEATPEFRTGKVCYLEIPSADPERSAAFSRSVFGWTTSARGDGALAFDDTVGQVSGTWVTDRSPMEAAGLVVYLMVADADAAVAAIQGAGGRRPAGI